MVDVNMLKGVPWVFALLCAIKHQCYQVTITANDLTHVDATHTL